VLSCPGRTPESGHRAGFDGAKKWKGTKVHREVDTLRHLLILTTLPAHEQDWTHVEALCHNDQKLTGGRVELVFADQGYTGEHALEAARRANGGEASRRFTRSCLIAKALGGGTVLAWLSRFRRLGPDLEWLSSTLIGFHFVAACVLLPIKLRSILR